MRRATPTLGHAARFTVEKLRQRLALVAPLIHRESVALPPFRMQTVARAATYEDARAGLREDAWQDVAPASYWGEWETDFVLRTDVTVPAAWADGPLSLVLSIGDAGEFIHPEATVRLDGVDLGACDRYHQEIRVPARFADGASHNLELHGWTGLGGRLGRGEAGRKLFMGRSILALTDERLRTFVARARTALGAAEALGVDDPARSALIGAVDAGILALDTRAPLSQHLPPSLDHATQTLDEALSTVPRHKVSRIGAAGHAHMDLAWLWSTRQTRLKATRTFSTVLRLMDEFPQYRFTQSQPQLYAWIAEQAPALFDEIRSRVAEGRWEPTGGMWVEADCNLSGAEALARQFLLGRRYFRDAFGEGADTPVLWLPDVFGYSWSLPQLIRAAGMDYFFTIKIGWNQHNRMPFDSFWWAGIDGTRVLTHFSPTPGESAREVSTYNAAATSQQMVRTWQNFQQKDVHDALLMSFGHGDGGGGPTREMLENIAEMDRLPAGPAVGHTFAGDFFRALEREAGDRLPVWNGELYLEYHRGTYTTHARTKRNNRKAEVALHDAELLCSMALIRDPAFDYPAREFERLWKLVCLNQFHDIIPGTSIAEAYDEAEACYADVFASLEAVRGSALAVLSRGCEFALVNPVDAMRADVAVIDERLPDGTALVDADGRRYATQPVDGGTLVDVAGLAPFAVARCLADRGAAAETGLSISRNSIENAFLRVEIEDGGSIRAIRDKRTGRDVLPPGTLANEFQGFEDRPMNWDAWDIDPFYDDRCWGADPAHSVEIEERGPLRAALRVKRRFMSSSIEQTISMTAGRARIDFDTRIDWRERHMLLKVAFPVAILSPVASHEIQWGHVQRPTHRNTSWDWARFETCAHKWVDLSEGDYGVSLLNDCKYGHDVLDNVLRLTLLRSPTHPDPEADQGRHRFTYALLPHVGALGRETIDEAYCLNDPAMIHRGSADGNAGGSAAFLSRDRDTVVIETIKKAEDGRGLVVRLFEAMRTRGSIRLATAFPIHEVWRTNLIEDDETRLEDDGWSVTLDVRPFEIVTLRIIPDDPKALRMRGEPFQR